MSDNVDSPPELSPWRILTLGQKIAFGLIAVFAGGGLLWLLASLVAIGLLACGVIQDVPKWLPSRSGIGIHG